jgi:RNA polymerase sigma factor (sigma-70 family)
MAYERHLMDVGRLHTEFGDYLLTCLRLYGVPDAECEDVRQDLYLKLLEKGRTIRDTSVKGFCSKIARDAAVDYLRKADRMPTMENCIVVDEDGVEGLHPELNQMAIARWKEITGNPNAERILEALELSEMYEMQPGGPTAREVIEDLLYGLTQAQIAEKHGLSQQMISKWLRGWYRWIGKKLPTS